MNFPIQGTPSLVLAVVFGAIFGALLHRGRVANYNTIVNQFLFRDFTVLRVMLTAIVVGGVGVALLHHFELVQYHIKSADLLAVVLGAAVFGIGMVLYGYCPGTGVAAVGTGSLHALVGFVGMLIGGIVYALTFPWVKETLQPVASFGKVRWPEVTGVPELVWFAGLAIVAVALFRYLDQRFAS